MSNRETTFENAKVKDLVFCSLVGNQLLETNGQIIGIAAGAGIAFPLSVEMDNGNIMNFDFAGNYLNVKNAAQVLFWSNPHIIAPVRSKKKERKKLYIGINKIDRSSGAILYNTCAYFDRERLVRSLVNPIDHYDIKEFEIDLEE